MRLLTSVVTALFFALPLCAEVQLPAETASVRVGRMERFTYVSKGKVTWRVVGGAGKDSADLFREYDANVKNVVLRFLPYDPGKYWLIVADCNGEQVLTICEITAVGEPVPDKPKPKPPDPPSPDAADPALVAKFKTALVQDMGDKKHVLGLSKVYILSADLLEGVNDPNVSPKTVGELYAKMFATSIAEGVPRLPALAKVRGVIDETLGRGNESTVLDTETKKAWVAKLRRVGLSLKEAGQ